MNLRLSKSLKGLAIIIVVVSHYYRFMSQTSKLGFLYHTGFLGAALFAFLSGYGITMSYKKKGFYKNWFLKKIVSVYMPFIVVNIFTEMIFKQSSNLSKNYFTNILLGTNDSVLWYVPFIMVFYVLFYTVFYHVKNPSNGLLILTGIYVIYIFVCEFTGILGSPWYTSSGGLMLGVYLGYFDVTKYTSKLIASSFIFTIIFGFINMKYSNNILLKDWTTIISAICFCLFIFLITLLIFEGHNNYYKEWILRPFLFLGNISYWVYITHMKVVFIYNLLDIRTSLLVFLVFVFLESYIAFYIYTKISNKLFLKIH